MLGNIHSSQKTVLDDTVEHKVYGLPEHIFSEWLSTDVENLTTAHEIAAQLEASGVRETEVLLLDQKVRVRWR